VRLGPQHIKSGRIKFIPAKNEHRANPVPVNIELFSDLAKIIAATKSGHMTFLTTEYGKPFTPNGFSNKFREWCDEAGLPHCSAHGVRKQTATRLAECGASAHEIMAVLAHKSLAEAERYTREVQRRKLADSPMARLEPRLKG
jgi:integrase/recombinase XerD